MVLHDVKFQHLGNKLDKCIMSKCSDEKHGLNKLYESYMKVLQKVSKQYRHGKITLEQLETIRRTKQYNIIRHKYQYKMAECKIQNCYKYIYDTTLYTLQYSMHNPDINPELLNIYKKYYDKFRDKITKQSLMQYSIELYDYHFVKNKLQT